MYIIRKYIIYLYELYEQVEKRAFGEVSQRLQNNFIFNDNVLIFLCLSSNMKKSKTPAKWHENN